jgi:SAM-dependent methyltransferase
MEPARHDHVHLDESDWQASVERLEREGEAFSSFVAEAAALIQALRGSEAPPAPRIFDIGSGPGVGTCELARLFPTATVIAIDSSPAMLDRVSQRVTAHGLDDRVRTQVAELPDGVQGLGPVDVIWASMSLHHVGDEVAALRALRELLAPEGLLAIAERGDPMRVLPDDLDIGQPGLAERLDRAEEKWFADMRVGLRGSGPSADLLSMLGTAGFAVADAHLAAARLDPPLTPNNRRVAIEHLRWATHQLTDHLGADDLAALATLTDIDDPRSLVHRPDMAIVAYRQIVIARPVGPA